ncbi:hypothetical protein Ahy_B10g105511 [Arachis hypogaea]|uniref:Uncharacterized protein n=1 Tax=Arachis hypogaea TaxID=3818 RepID=A0A444X863_ARAHY|nr:hypothetical protein Ahy_B10g105511 [Arachis hypogaea]
MGALGHPFIMVPNRAPSTLMTPPPSAQQPTILTTFTPNNNAFIQKCTNVIKLMYDHPWPSYKKIPAETRERWFQKWDKTHDPIIRKIFDHRIARQFQQMLEDTDEGFKRRRLTNRANRALARSSKYTSGSATFMKTKAKLSIDCEAMMAETFITHRPWIIILEAVTQQSQRTRDDDNNSTASVVDPDRIWCEDASEPYKNCMYRLGSFFIDNLRTSTLRQSTSATIRPINLKDNVDLREKVLILTRSLHHQAHQLYEPGERYQAILSLMTDTDDLRLE